MSINKFSLKTFLLLLSFFFFSTHSFAQKKKKTNIWKLLNTPTTPDSTDKEYYKNNTIRYEDYVYKPNIKTVKLFDISFELSQPIINLESDEILKLSFDDLDGDLKSYMFSIIHCNANWEPSDLMANEYIEGFTDNPISDYRVSFNTLQPYTHYNLVFPNSGTKITKSGNYILKVYDSNPENIVLTKRFMVYQSKVSIESRVTPASLVEFRNYKQEIDFTIKHPAYRIDNPFGDLKVVITQNNRWDNAKRDLKPLFVKDEELVYDYDDVNVFDGGNEFRFFDIKTLRYHTERVNDIRTDSTGIHVLLLPDEKRSFKRYSTEMDMNGNYLVKVQEGTNSEVEADYCDVHFFLPLTDAMLDGTLYVFGAFNDWKCNKENRMQFNVKRMGYECNLYLKQGYYNYEYAFIRNGETEADQTYIEGMHFETENDYTIYVYYKQTGTFYDQLIGVKRLNSKEE